MAGVKNIKRREVGKDEGKPKRDKSGGKAAKASDLGTGQARRAADAVNKRKKRNRSALDIARRNTR